MKGLYSAKDQELRELKAAHRQTSIVNNLPSTEGDLEKNPSATSYDWLAV
jgi:hypothetical protein